MDEVDILSLFRLYSEYLEVVKLNCNPRQKVKQNKDGDDPLNYKTKKTINKKNGSNKNQGIKRKYLMSENEPKKPRKKGKKKVATTDNVESGDGVTQEQLLQQEGIDKIDKRHNRRWWVRKENIDRDKSGYFASTYRNMKTSNPDEFFELTKMEIPIYEKLLNLVKEDLTKTSIRTPIDYECRLAVTLTYLSQGTPFFQLASTFQMGKSTIREIIMNTCDIIWKHLSPEYVKELNVDDYIRIANEFQKTCKLPNCIGIFDSKILSISIPSGRYDLFKNLKSLTFSTICDANHIITWADLHPYDYQESLDIFDYKLTQMLGEKKLPRSEIFFPYYYVGDATFPFKKNVMRPYPTKVINGDKKKIIFNTYLSNARNIAENTFGLLAARWTVLQSEFKCFPKNCKRIILAVVALHNFIMINSIKGQNKYCPTGFLDWEDELGNSYQGDWRKEVQKIYIQAKIGPNVIPKTAITLREILTNYFS